MTKGGIVSVQSLTDFKKEIEKIKKDWGFDEKNIQGINCPWFRGQNKNLSLRPRLFQKEDGDEASYNEFWMSTTFRNRVPFLKTFIEWERIDRWLFLMQHYCCPTRLLDWTEDELFALYFSIRNIDKDNIKNMEPIVWILNPEKLNQELFIESFPNTWAEKPIYIGDRRIEMNPALIRFKLAFYPENMWRDLSINGDLPTLDSFAKPIAIQANYIDRRLLRQKSCFTIHGTDKRSFEHIYVNSIFLEKFLRPIKIDIRKEYSVDKNMEIIRRMKQELEKLHITEEYLFPIQQEDGELNILARELKERFSENKK